MKPAHGLNQPVVNRLGRTGFVFLGTIALAAHAQSVPVQQPPGNSPTVAQDPAQQPTAVTPPAPPPTRPAEVPAAVPASTPDPASTHFITEVSRLAKRGIELAQLARERATRTAVREFAAALIADHRTIDESLAAVGSEWELRMRRDGHAERELRQLNQARGGTFDEAFLGFVIRDHERALELIGDLEDGEMNPRIRSFVDEHADKLRRHLQHARQLSNDPPSR